MSQNLLLEAEAEIDLLQRLVAGWQASALRYHNNAEYWRSEALKAAKELDEARRIALELYKEGTVPGYPPSWLDPDFVVPR